MSARSLDHLANRLSPVCECTSALTVVLHTLPNLPGTTQLLKVEQTILGSDLHRTCYLSLFVLSCILMKKLHDNYVINEILQFLPKCSIAKKIH